MFDQTTAEIIGAIVRVVPLILIPFLLKGILDEIPVVGKAAQNAMNRASKHTDRLARDSGLMRNRYERYMNGERNLLGGRSQTGRTAGAFLRGHRQMRDDQLEAIKTGGKERARARMANADVEGKGGSLFDRQARQTLRAYDAKEREHERGKTTDSFLEARSTIERDDKKSVLGQERLRQEGNKSVTGALNAKFEKEMEEARTRPKDPSTPANVALNEALSQAGVSREGLIRRADDVKAYNQAKGTASNKQIDDYSQRIYKAQHPNMEGLTNTQELEDQSLLSIASGNIDVQGGVKRARGYAADASKKVRAQNVAAAQAYQERQMAERQLQIVQSTSRNSAGKPLDAQGAVIDAPNTILEQALAYGDVDEALAARNGLMSQGGSGANSFANAMLKLEESPEGSSASFKGRSEALAALKTTQLSEYGKQSKESVPYMLTWGAGNLTVREAMQDKARYTSRTYGQIAGETTQSILTGIANGAYTEDTAMAILSDDKIRNQFDQSQTDIFETLRDHGKEAVARTWNQIDGKLWEKSSNNGTYGEWVEATSKAKAGFDGRSVAADGSYIDDDSEERSSSRSNGLEDASAPKPGSITPLIKEFVDKRGGVRNLSKRLFVETQAAIKKAPDRDPDNKDLEGLIISTDAEVERRNNDAKIINDNAVRYTNGPAVRPENEYRPLNMGPAPKKPEDRPQADSQPESNSVSEASARFTTDSVGDTTFTNSSDSGNMGTTSGQREETTQPQPVSSVSQGQTYASDQQGVAERVASVRKIGEQMRSVADSFGIQNIQDLGITREELEDLAGWPQKQARLFSLFDNYRASRSRVINDDPTQVENLRNQLRDEIRKVMEDRDRGF